MSISHSLVLTDFRSNVYSQNSVSAVLAENTETQREHYLYIQCMVEANSGCTVIIQE